MKFNLKVLSAVTILLGLLCNQAIFASSASKQKPEKKDEANLNQNKEKQKEKKGTDAIKENYVMPSDKVMPNDSQVRYGKLDNGLTYYIRKNQKPENRAEFYIAQNVGSILEEEEQRGLAHFLEHMAFNGTKNFPDNTLREYLEKNGVKFGANLNAYTSIDETV